MFFPVAPDAQLQPVGQSVNNRNADAVQSARHLVGVIVKLPACMKLGHDHFCCGNPFFFMDTHRNTTSVVHDRHAGICVNNDTHMVRMTGQSFINAVVHDLIHHVVQTRAIVRIPDIHSGAFSNCLQAFENFDRISTIFVWCLCGLCHAGLPTYFCHFIAVQHLIVTLQPQDLAVVPLSGHSATACRSLVAHPVLSCGSDRNYPHAR